jgi:hypothetical protein
MAPKKLVILIALAFVCLVGSYIGMLSWQFGRFRDTYISEFVLASALAVAMVRGGIFARWLVAVISMWGSVSSFKMALYPYPDGSTAYGLMIPGIGFALCACAIVTLEAAHYFRESLTTKQ